MADFLQALHSGRVLLMDGAMGTELQRAGMAENACYEEWNLSRPEKVRAIHQAYVDAGAEVLLTNTFQANRATLSRHGLESQQGSILEKGLDLARSMAGSRFVVASVGPIELLKPDRATLESIQILLRLLRNADAVLLETCADFKLLLRIEKIWVSEVVPPTCPLFVSIAFHHGIDGVLQTYTRMNVPRCVRRARRLGLSGLGVNCGKEISMDDLIEIVSHFHSELEIPIFARPNAGTPKRVGDRWVYPHTPEAMAARLPELLEAGVSMIGGCCGTTPAHIAAFRPIVAAWNAKRGFTAVK